MRNQARVGISYRLRLAALLAASLVLRLWLVIGGGQGFWPDESRYDSARKAAVAILHASWREAMVQLFGHADHVLSRVMALPVALVEAAMGAPQTILVSCYFAAFSVVLIVLVWAVAGRAGASEREAFWAAFLAAASNCLFFYARHFLPYDTAACVLLFALWLSLGSSSAGNSSRVGAVVALGVLTYNGYWLLGGSILLIHILFGDGKERGLLKRAAWASLGFGAVLVAVIALGAVFSPDLIQGYRNFAGSIKQGDFYLGYRVVPEFIWYSERGIALLWLASLGYAVGARGLPRDSRRLTMWATGAGVILAGLIFFSDVVPRLMVYGRLTREMVPFLCLGSAIGINRFLENSEDSGRAVEFWLGTTVIALAAFNFWTPLVQVFPDRFRERAAKVVAGQRGQGYGIFRLLYAESLWGQHLDIKLPPHMELLRSPHPMQFRPLQYEGYAAALRAEINGNDVAMQLAEVPFRKTPESSMWEGYPGPVRIRLLLKPDYWGESEPLLSAGKAGEGSLVSINYIDAKHISLGVRVTGRPELVSGPVQVDYAVPHEIVLSAAPLLPGANGKAFIESPKLGALRERVVIVLDGQVALSAHAQLPRSEPEELSWGLNAVGDSVAQPHMRSLVYEFGSAPLDSYAVAVPSLAAGYIAWMRSGEWEGSMGPVRLSFTVPPGYASGRVNLISTRAPGMDDVVYVERAGGQSVRIGYERNGSDSIESQPMELSATGAQELDISLGSLLPEGKSPLYAEFPGFDTMRNEVCLRFNGVTAVLAKRPFDVANSHGITIGENSAGYLGDPRRIVTAISSVKPIGPENFPGLGFRLFDILGNPDPAWAGFTGPLKLKLVFPRGQQGRREPILVSGSRGHEDTLFVEYGSEGEVRFGFERQGEPTILSSGLKAGAGLVQELVVNSGDLMPPAGSAIYPAALELDALRSFVQLSVNGTPVLHVLTAPRAPAADASWLGFDPFAAVPIRARFSGSIEAVSRVDPEDIFDVGHLPSVYGRPGWGGYPGPLKIVVDFAAGGVGDGQPILTTGLHGIGDVIFLRFEANGMARICQDHWGSRLLLSEPFRLSLSGPHAITVSMGSLYPPGTGAPPGSGMLSAKTVVTFDGHTVLSSAEPCHPSTPGHITVGANLIGATTAQPLLSGQILEIGLAPLPAGAR